MIELPRGAPLLCWSTIRRLAGPPFRRTHYCHITNGKWRPGRFEEALSLSENELLAGGRMRKQNQQFATNGSAAGERAHYVLRPKSHCH